MGTIGSEAGDAFDSPTFGKDGSFHVDKPVGSMSISPCGRDVVLASRHGLHIVDLDSPYTPPRHLPHLTPWEVADVQWSPFASRDYWVVSTSNQKALVWNLAMSSPSASIEHVLHAHTRAITDINFSAHHPDLLATCAVDSFVHCWDLRHPARPAITFCDWFAGATQVKWNRQEGHIIASSHDKVLRIWDDRKGAHPLRSIVAHSTKIYGIDWNRTEARSLVTCSLDKSIKFWNFETSLEEPEQTLTTAFPVWRARHTPFGQGLLAMPQRNDYNVHLYYRQYGPEGAHISCVKQFTGHENHVKEFLWRTRGFVDHENDNREWQLVTWGNDRSLRLHKMTDADLNLVGHKRGTSTNSNLLFTRRDAAYKTFREDSGSKFRRPTHLNVGTEPASSELDSTFDFHRPSVKSVVPSPSIALGGWMSGGFVNSRYGSGKQAIARKDLDPIAWMKGVKIGKREPVSEQNMPSMISPNYQLEKSADEFESLGDEITHVGTKFSRVEFSRVEVQKRFVQLSLHGPWGHKHSMTYLNCRIEFPTEYPQNRPQISIEKTAALPDEAITRLQQESKKLLEVFQLYSKPSFEAIIRYLQGEQTLDDLTAWSKDDPDTSVYDFAADSDGSSSDDEDDLGAFVANQDGDTGLTGSGVLSVSNANVNVPLARTCGATWSPNGKLTCFFVRKDDFSQSFAGSLGFDDRSSFSKLKKRELGGIGKFYPPSSTLKSKTSSIGTLESDDSDIEYSSDSSDLSSSSSWHSTREVESRSHYLNTKSLMRPSIYPFQGPEKLADDARRSNPSISATKSRTGASKSYISIHDLADMLPSRQALGKRYEIDSKDACLKNAAAAREYGSIALAQAWTLIDMILKDTVPLKVIPLPGLTDPEVGTMPEAVIGIDATFADIADWKATVKWGNHPFGKSFLVEQLFTYFAKLGDIQMLAMMSCMFYCPPPLPDEQELLPESETTARGNFRHTLSAVLASPAVASPNRVDYFRSLEVAASLLHPEQTISLSPKDRNGQQSTSLSSSLGIAGQDAIGSYTSVVTPPLASKLSRRSSDIPESGSFPLSSSPERTKWMHRSGSHLANALSSSFHRPFFTASASSSPPNAYPRKRMSPVGSFGGAQTHISGALPSKTISRSLSNTEEPRLEPRVEHFGAGRRNNFARTSKPPQFRVRLKNQDQFYNDGYSDTSLLKPADSWRYSIWRALYADLLATWGLSIKRAEILKYNDSALAVDHSQGLQTKQSHPDFTIGKRVTQEDPQLTWPGTIQLAPVCAVCGPIESQDRGSSQRCVHQRRRSLRMLCLLCEEQIQGRAGPCLNCGHIMHASCWQAAIGNQKLAYYCLAGCGCRCGEHAQVAGSRIESDIISGSSHALATTEAKEAGKSLTSDRAQLGEDVAYESLVENLRRSGKSTWRPRNRSIHRSS